MDQLSVYCPETELRPSAEALAGALGLVVTSVPAAGYQLCFERRGLVLLCSDQPKQGGVYCDFTGGSAAHRRLFGGGRGQAIAKAVGLSSSFSAPRVLDVSAGLGADGFVLASLGCQMTLLERNSTVYALLHDGLRRLLLAEPEQPELGDIAARMSLQLIDAAEYMRQCPAHSFDVVYVDPMFPARNKSAKVKKEMQAFHRVVGGDDDADQLLALAIEQARYRVVVKRPAKAPWLAQRKPSYSLNGKSTRFDIYTNHAVPR